MSLIEHLEKHLGKIDQGWGESSTSSKVVAVRFRDQPMDGVVTYVTLGMSNHVLQMPKGLTVRQELVFIANEQYPSAQIASFLYTFSDFLISKKRALLRGDVIGPSTPVIPGVRMNSVYAAIPVVFEDSFATYRSSDPATVFVWLVPLIESEASIAKKIGWSKFEDFLERENIDFWNLDRAPIFINSGDTILN